MHDETADGIASADRTLQAWLRFGNMTNNPKRSGFVATLRRYWFRLTG